MKSIGLIVNSDRDIDYEYTAKVVDVLQSNGFGVYLHSSVADVAFKVPIIRGDSFYEKSDALLTLGGDGTLLRVAEKAALYQKPILGINLGHLGYLAQLEKKDIGLLPEILSGDTALEYRSMLEIGIVGFDGHEEKHYALNELVLGRQILSNMLHAAVYSNDEFVYEFHCDGLIFATPTGSTAYSMSSGGPIVDSGLQDIIIFTPVCEHSFFSKSMIFSSKDVLSCVVTKQPENSYLIIDGKTIGSTETIQKIMIRKAEYDLPLFKTSENRFYKVLNDKFSDGGNR